MACLTINIVPVSSPTVAVAALAAAVVIVSAVPNPSLAVTTEQQASTAVLPSPQPSVTITAEQQARVMVGEVCSVGVGKLVVLAASDGPLRTKSGGYIPINPATNPPV